MNSRNQNIFEFINSDLQTVLTKRLAENNTAQNEIIYSRLP